MLTHIISKGLITDLAEQKDQKNHKNSLINGVVSSTTNFFENFENVFFLLKTFISRSNLNVLSSSVLQTSQF